MAHIRLDNVTKQYGGATALRDMSLDIPDGEFFVLLGPTGAGKTTTLRLIAGLDQPTAGSIAIGDEDVRGWSAAERDVALVFQYCSLYPRYTVRQNLAFPLKSRVRSYTAEQIEERVQRAAKTLRITHLLERKTDKLSGGEMQRVSIGRAIVREPKAFLMDEPLSNLDAKLQRGAPRRAEGLADEARRDLPVRHARPDRGDVDGRQGRHPERTAASCRSAPRSRSTTSRAMSSSRSFVGSPAMNLIEGELRDGRVSVFSGKLAVPYSAPKATGARAGDARHPLGGCSAHRPGRGDGSARSRCREPWRREDRDAQGGRSSVQGNDSVRRWR